MPLLVLSVRLPFSTAPETCQKNKWNEKRKEPQADSAFTGGCFAVQQIDTNTKTNIASQIATAATLDEVQAQVQQDQKDFAAAVAANQADGTPEQVAALANVAKLVGPSLVSKAAVVQTPAADAANQAAVASATPTSATTNSNSNGKKKGSKAKGN